MHQSGMSGWCIRVLAAVYGVRWTFAKCHGMPLTLCHHPLSCYCHKVLLALHENGTESQGGIVEMAIIPGPLRSSQQTRT